MVFTIAVKTSAKYINSQKVRCPECHGRICDVVVSEQEKCKHRYRIIFDGNIDSLIAIKCQKCGKVVGLGITQ